MKPKPWHDREVLKRARLKRKIMLSEAAVLPPKWKLSAARHRLWRSFILQGKHFSLRGQQTQMLGDIVRRRNWPQLDEKYYGHHRVPIRFWNRRTNEWMDVLRP